MPVTLRKVTEEERKQIQLDMLSEIDTFCKANGIRYSLAYGTLLGAVRHKGFIPWDDDVDIMMPLPDLLRFKAIFSSETMSYIDIDINPNYRYPFPRVIHTLTYSKMWKLQDEPGINIDIYPILGLPNDKNAIDRFFEKAKKVREPRLFLMRVKANLAKIFPVRHIPLFTFTQKRFRDFLFQYHYCEQGPFFCFGGELEWRNVYFEDLFLNLEDVAFEGRIFKVIKNYDLFLKQFYGDYMQLPPEEDRHPYHCGNYYWKE